MINAAFERSGVKVNGCSLKVREHRVRKEFHHTVQRKKPRVAVEELTDPQNLEVELKQREQTVHVKIRHYWVGLENAVALARTELQYRVQKMSSLIQNSAVVQRQ